jgi:tetratricopeptide (TPR) repeat protein
LNTPPTEQQIATEPSAAIAHRRPSPLRWIGFVVALTVLVVIVAAGFIRELMRDPIFVEPIAVPADVVRAGITPEIASERLLAEFERIRERAQTAGGAPKSILAREKTDARLAHAGVSMQAPARFVRAMFGRPELRIDGEIARSSDGYSLTLRTGSQIASVASVPNSAGAIDELLTTGAEDLMTILAPSTYGYLVMREAYMTQDFARMRRYLAIVERTPAAGGVPYHFGRGFVLAGEGNFREAIAEYEKVDDSANDPRVHLAIAHCYAGLGERNEALARIASAERISDRSPQMAAELANAYDDVELYDKSLAKLLEARKGHVALRAWADLQIGYVLIDLHRPAEAIAWFEAHGDPVADNRARWLYGLAIANTLAGDGPRAAALAQDFRAATPSSPYALDLDAEIALASRNYERALDKVREYQARLPMRRYEVSETEGRAYLGLRNYRDAETAFRECLRLRPFHAACELGLGVALREADEPEQGLAALDNAARLDSLDPQIAIETAKTLRALGRRGDAADAQTRADTLQSKLAQPLGLPS